ncbi:terminase small subunit [Maridesulfovibrio sp.]|uniref:terminase small subunit n=1 Tax=Maridesulfovibrio sp. TaxID=2795000 RepID=UPI002AA6EFC1|nr:terminase small subunit [Maridesulfovibrio sp.]
MQPVIDEYFDRCKAAKEPPTVTGLALALGFSTRQALLNYENGERGETEQVQADFVDTIKKAKSRIEEIIERDLIVGAGNPVGKIFHLKNNCGWIDKQEIESNNTGVTVNIAAFGTPEGVPQMTPQIAAQAQPVDTVSSGQCIETIKVQGVYEEER